MRSFKLIKIAALVRHHCFPFPFPSRRRHQSAIGTAPTPVWSGLFCSVLLRTILCPLLFSPQRHIHPHSFPFSFSLILFSTQFPKCTSGSASFLYTFYCIFPSPSLNTRLFLVVKFSHRNPFFWPSRKLQDNGESSINT